MVLFSETIMTFRDAISALSAFALNTSKIKLGCTQITRIRTPLVMRRLSLHLTNFLMGE